MLPKKMKNIIRTIEVSALLGTVALIVGLIADMDGMLEVFRKIASAKIMNYPVPLWSLLLLLVGLILVAVLIVARMRKDKPNEDASLILNRGQFYGRLQEMLVNARKRVLIIGLEKEWIFPLVISIFVARDKDVTIDVINYSTYHERYRLLELLGCNVYHADREKLKLPIEGVLADPKQILFCCAALHNPREKENIYGKYYYGSLDHFAIRSTYEQSCAIVECASKSSDGNETLNEAQQNFAPEMVPVKEEELISRMKSIRFYGSASIKFEDVLVDDVYPVSNYVVKFKLVQILELMRIYKEKGWELFHPCAIKLKNGNESIVIPPVIEEHDGKLYIAEGHSRFYILRQKGMKTVKAIVVRGVVKDLPLKPTTWKKVEVVDEKHEHRTLELARHIETTVHQNVWGLGDSYPPTVITPTST